MRGAETMIVLASRSDWSVLTPLLVQSVAQTLEMVVVCTAL